MKEEEVNRCQIQEWMHKFRLVTFRTMIEELPETFIDHLLLGEQVGGEQLPVPFFPNLEKRVEKLIKALNGEVYVKLNWSSPKDSSLIRTNEDGMCTSFKEIVLLLKSSKSVAHDLSHAYDLCSDKTSSRPPKFFLAICQCYPPSEMEFRCFVKDQHIVAISQKNLNKVYPSLDGMKTRIQDRVQNFFTSKVKENFESVNYTFDVYLNSVFCVKLVDFNPWGKVTQPLLFTWEYMENVGRRRNGAEFRTLGHWDTFLFSNRSISSNIRLRNVQEDVPSATQSRNVREDDPSLPVPFVPFSVWRRNLQEDVPSYIRGINVGEDERVNRILSDRWGRDVQRPSSSHSNQNVSSIEHQIAALSSLV